MARPRRPSTGRAEGRLDPVRWHRPGRGTLLRLAAVAALLITAALISWSGPPACAPVADEARAKQRPPPSATGPAEVTARDGKPATSQTARARVPPGTVGVPVRLADPTALALVQPGDHVDLLRVEGDPGNPAASGNASPGTSPVAAAALVLGVTGADDPTTGGLLIALTPAEAAAAVTGSGRGFAVLIRP